MRHSTRDPAPYFDRLALFEGLAPRDHAILATVFRVRDLELGEELCKEGEPAHSLFVVARGTIEIRKHVPRGGEESLGTVGPDNLLGQVGLIDRKGRSATLVASEPATVLECSSDDFERLFHAEAPFALRLMDRIVQDLAKRLRQADEQFVGLFRHPDQTRRRLWEAALDIERALEVSSDDGEKGQR